MDALMTMILNNACLTFRISQKLPRAREEVFFFAAWPELRLASAILYKAMLAEGDSVEKVARCSGLSLDEVRALQSSLQHA